MWPEVKCLFQHSGEDDATKSDLGTLDVGAQAAKEPIREMASNTRVRGGLEG